MIFFWIQKSCTEQIFVGVFQGFFSFVPFLRAPLWGSVTRVGEHCQKHEIFWSKNKLEISRNERFSLLRKYCIIFQRPQVEKKKKKFLPLHSIRAGDSANISILPRAWKNRVFTTLKQKISPAAPETIVKKNLPVLM